MELAFFIAASDSICAITNANGAQRIAWTDMWLKAREWFLTKLDGLPVEVHYDSAANRWITLKGASDKVLILGSHLDSVPNGGWLDGELNVLAGLEILRRIASEFNGRPPVTVRLVDWADEEGARFGRSLLGSSAFAGTASIAADRVRTDREGVKMEDASAAIGRIAETGQLNFEGDREQKLGVDLRHGDPLIKMTGVRHFIEVNGMD